MPSKAKSLVKTTLEPFTNPDVNTLQVITDPHLRELALKQDLVASYIVLTLQRGGEASNTRFPVHSGLLTALRNCYSMDKPSTFLDILTTYLNEAATHLPHCLSKEEVPHLIERLKELFETLSFSYVARYLLRGIPV